MMHPVDDKPAFTLEQLISDPNFPTSELTNKKISEIMSQTYSYFMNSGNKKLVYNNLSTDFSLSLFINQVYFNSEIQSDQIDSITIYIPNFYTANLDLNPIFCVGTELNSALNLDTLNDYIPGWYYTEDGIYSEILLNEILALAEERMVNIYNCENPADSLDIPNDIDRIHLSAYKESQASTSLPYTHSYQINYRYESSGDSEYNMRILTVWSGG
ncbi:MAG: hypothetical protein ACK4IY_05555, partial [Chitinophagales bacterium]